MARGISLHIGVNKVDHSHYKNMSDLDFCEADARVMQQIARSRKFKTRSLLGEKATRDNVSNAVKAAAEELEAGDIFLITYAGHGCYIPDKNKDERKVYGRKFDRNDETWCLYDAQQVDDERWMLWSGFKEGVRICVLSDSCHSGTTARSGGSTDKPTTFKKRSAEKESADATYEAHKAFYDKCQVDGPAKIDAELMLISGCQDNQESGEDSKIGHGNFTHALKETWDKGEFTGTYRDLWKAVKVGMPDWQTPNMSPKRPKFANEKPFTIDP